MTIDRRRAPTIHTVMGSQANRLLRAEQRQDPKVTSRTTLATAASAGLPPFSLSGGVVVSTSPPWTPFGQVTISNVRVLLGTAGSSTTTVALKKNGTTFATVSLASSATDSTPQLATATLAPGDLLTVAVTAAGTSASDLTVVLA